MQNIHTPSLNPNSRTKVCFSSASSFHHSTTLSVHNGWELSHSSSETSSDDESDLTVLPSDNEVEESTPKLPGESGRPKSEGYNLKHASHLKAFDNIFMFVLNPILANILSHNSNVLWTWSRTQVRSTQGGISIHKNLTHLNLYTKRYVCTLQACVLSRSPFAGSS